MRSQHKIYTLGDAIIALKGLANDYDGAEDDNKNLYVEQMLYIIQEELEVPILVSEFGAEA
jgi:hypothetical protein|tara:strand:- start:3667 stop:3849 length:183 start_codon:yes stop_codon:yes gene_type:complete